MPIGTYGGVRGRPANGWPPTRFSPARAAACAALDHAGSTKFDRPQKRKRFWGARTSPTRGRYLKVAWPTGVSIYKNHNARRARLHLAPPLKNITYTKKERPYRKIFKNIFIILLACGII